MARVRSNLETAKARLRLAVRQKSYSVPLAPGIQLLYRRNLGSGAWSVKTKKWIKKIAVADDFEPANGTTVLNYWDAQKRASELARVGEGNVVEPVTVEQAVDDYEKDLKARGASKFDASTLRFNLEGSPLLTKPVTLLISKELRDWRNGLVDGGLAPASADRIGRSLRAALNLAARGDKRVKNSAEWRDALSRLQGSNKARDNVILNDATVQALVAELHAEDGQVGLWGELLAETGCRESQGVKLRVSDLQDDHETPRLMLPCSLKGQNRLQESKPVPISVRLGTALRKAAAGRQPNDALIDPVDKLSAAFKPAVKRLGLGREIVPYSLRHSSIVRMLLKGVPIRVVASHHDTSVGEIERVYSRHISDVSDDLTRATLPDLSEPAADKVVSITRRAAR
jgi:integrase